MVLCSNHKVMQIWGVIIHNDRGWLWLHFLSKSLFLTLYKNWKHSVGLQLLEPLNSLWRLVFLLNNYWGWFQNNYQSSLCQRRFICPLRPLNPSAKFMSASFRSISFTHVRQGNCVAYALAKRAISNANLLEWMN